MPDVFPLPLILLAIGLWCAWWLWAVNWKKAWPVLAQGAWVPVLLFVFTVALAWAGVAGNFWRHLGLVGGLALLTLFCGWLQGKLGWAPEDVSFEPASDSGHHGHAGHH
jgi:hypothetical protein